MTIKTKLDQQFVSELSERKGEPAWMRERRLAAWEQFETVPVPHYERTKLRDSHFQSFDEPYSGAEKVTSFEGLPAALQEAIGDPEGRTLIVQRNSEVVFKQIQELPEGVIVTDLDSAVQEHPDLVEKYFLNRDFPGGDNKVVALNGALHSGGLFVYVPEGAHVRKAVEFILWIDEPGAAVFDHSIVVAEDRARVRVIEMTAGGEGKAYRYGVQELFTGEGARVLCGNVQTFGPKVQNLVVRRTVPGERSSTDWISAEFGADMSVNEIDNRVDGRGSEVRGLGVFFAADRQHLDLQMRMIHTARESGSDILVRGVSRDRARAVYSPYTRLRHDAKDSTGFQRGNTLVLDRSARAYSIPQLHVEEDEVQGAGHAATVGNVDELHLFYLMSRGLTEREAKKLIVDGFFFPVLEHIPIKAVRERVIGLIERKMAT